MEAGIYSPRESLPVEESRPSSSRAKLKRLMVGNRAIISASPRLRETYFRVHKKLEKQKTIEDDIYHDSLSVGVDYAHATGGELIDDKGFQALYDAGLATYPAIAIPVVYEDWPDLQEHIKMDYERDLSQRAEVRKELLDGLKNEIVQGTLPGIVTKKLHRGKSLDRALETEDGKIKNDVGFFDREEEADDEEKAKRYARILVARDLYPMILAEHTTSARRSEVTYHERVVSIGVMVNINAKYLAIHEAEIVEAGKFLSSFSAELNKSDPSLDSSEIETYVKSTPYYDILYPANRQKYLGQLVATVKKSRT